MLVHNKNTKEAENEKQTFFERLYWVVFQFFIQKHYDKVILFDEALLVQKKKKHEADG